MYVRHFNPFSIKTKLDLVKTFETAILNLKKKKKKKKVTLLSYELCFITSCNALTLQVIDMIMRFYFIF